VGDAVTADGLDTVLGKAVALLRAFTPDDHVLTLAELCRRTGLPKGTAHRVAADLVGHQLLDRVPGGYRLSGGLFELGMRAAVERTHETVHLGVADGHEVVYVAKIGGHRQAPAPSRIGGRMPLHCTAIGKILLAYGDQQLRRDVLSSPLERRTPHTVVAPGLLRRQLTRALETGVAFEREESTVGLLCVAAPVLVEDGSAAVAAISVTGPVGRFRPDSHVAAVRAAATGVASVLARRQR
jgi:DNA-binding IclR family transcriptional regulator